MFFSVLLLGIIPAILGVPSGSIPNNYNQNIEKGITNIHAQFTKLTSSLLKPEDNAIYSSVNLFFTLFSLYSAASGETKKELGKALGFSSDNNESQNIEESVAKFIQNLEQDRDVEISNANGLFFQKGTSIKENYLQKAKQLKFDVQSLDFTAGNEATSAVNKFVSEKTKGRISELFRSPIDQSTVILLAGVIYFSGNWQNKFSELETKLEKFNTGVKTIDVPTLSNTKKIRYYKDGEKGYEAIGIPYAGKEVVLLVILPNENQTLSNLINKLNEKDYQNLPSSLSDQYVHYKIPKLKIQSSESINRKLQDIGISKIFQNAELENLTDLKNLRISDVHHAAEIEIHENGTVASAATVIQIVRYSFQLPLENPILFHANRPFVLAIYDQKNKAYLFTAIVQNPSSLK